MINKNVLFDPVKIEISKIKCMKPQNKTKIPHPVFMKLWVQVSHLIMVTHLFPSSINEQTNYFSITFKFG